MDRVGDISLFLRVLDTGSISAAARTLDLSVAVASQRLKRLERELGVPLFQRTTRTLRITPEGESLAERGRVLVEELEALTGGLREAGKGVTGTLRLTTAAMFGRQYISPYLSEFLARHPDVRVSVDLNDHIHDLVSAGFDLAIRIGTLDDSSLVARRIATNRRVLCASAEYLRRHGVPKVPQDLERHDCLLLVGRQGPRDLWRLSDGKGGEIAVRVKGRIESNQGELLRDAALSGLGLGMFSTWHVCEDLQAGRLRVVLPDYPLADGGIHAVMPQRRLAPARVRAFVDFLMERFGDVPPWERRISKTKGGRL